MAKIAKRAQAFVGDAAKTLPLVDAVKQVKANAKAKFDESVEIAVNLASTRATPTNRSAAS